MSSDTSSVLSAAKLNPDDFLPGGFKLTFGCDLSSVSDVRFIETDGELVKAISEGKSVSLKGSAEDNAVICSDSKTYEIKEAETSNSMLFISKFLGPGVCSGKDLEIAEVEYLTNSYFELSLSPPKLFKLHNLLSTCYFKGEAEEREVDVQKLFSVPELTNQVQASLKEVVSCIAAMGAFSLNGYVRLLSFDLSCEMMVHVIQLCLENDWPLTSIPVEGVCKSLVSIYPKEILIHFLKFFSPEIPVWSDDNVVDNNIENVSLSRCKVCQLFGNMILKNGSKFRLRDFIDSWRQVVPNEMDPVLSDLEDSSIIDYLDLMKQSKEDTSAAMIWYFDKWILPVENDKRLAVLFAQKPAWSFNELFPFFKDLCDKAGLSTILAKYSRSSLVNGTRFYTKKLV